MPSNSTSEIINRLGQLIMIGLAGPSMTKAETAFIRDVNPAGVIYFGRNCRRPDQIYQLSKSLHGCFATPPLIGIDQEGGRVLRLPPPFTAFPSQRVLGQSYLQTGCTIWIRQVAKAMACEQRAVGINLNFSPVVDVDSQARNPIIGDRSFSAQPTLVAKLAKVVVREFARQGLVACAKHFPGHGDTLTDSHKVLPRVGASRQLLLRRELVPFVHMAKAKVPMMMTAHVLYPKLDKSLPATLSEKILQGLLRERLQYKGVVVSDDLEMCAISKHMSLPDASLMALAAGVDLLLVCKSLDESSRIVDALRYAVERGELCKASINASLRRVESLKRRYAGSLSMPRLRQRYSWPEHQRLIENIDKVAMIS